MATQQALKTKFNRVIMTLKNLLESERNQVRDITEISKRIEYDC